MASVAQTVKPRRRIRAAGERASMAGDLSETLFEMVLDLTTLRWPSTRYYDDPVGFFRDILGIEPWHKQVEVLESVRDNPRTAWKSGHRVSKSNTIGGSSLWFYCSHEDARVVLTAPVARSVEGILWREVRMMVSRAGRCVACRLEDPEGLRIVRPCAHSALIDGDLGERAATGLSSIATFREIKGYTAKDVEAITGTAGKNLFFGLDESSGVADEIFEGIEGNRAGWSKDSKHRVRLLIAGNPTKTSGEFYDAFNDEKKSKHYHCVTTSSRETPNYVEGREVIPGLATRDWVEDMESKYGANSAFVKVRVEGEFPIGEDGKIFSIHTIATAEQRWYDVAAEGRLYIGLDPAGESGMGDETAFVVRRGLKMLAMVALTGLTEEAHAAHLLGLIAAHKIPREKPVVVVDREGGVGAKVYAFLLALATPDNAPFELVGIRSSEKAHRQPLVYDLMRDELCANLQEWFALGGGILEDDKLAKELHVLEWEQQARGGRLKLTPKKEIKKLLKRSPDRYDALSLACWEPLSLREGGSGRGSVDDDDDDDDGRDGIDPYKGAGIDPYAHW